jgi:hypothetical protein
MGGMEGEDDACKSTYSMVSTLKCTIEHNERTNDLDLVVEEENRGHPSPPLRHSLETWTLKSPTLRGTGMKGNLHATVGGGFSQLLRF